MFRSFFASKKWATWAYGGGGLLFISVWLQVQMSVALNSWYKEFYDLFQKAGTFVDNPEEGIRQFHDLLISPHYVQSGFEGTPSFTVIAIPYILLGVFTAWFTQIYVFRWREAMTFVYLPRWKLVEQDIEGASQRIQEDCSRFARIIESLGVQVMRAIMTQIAFIPILWELSNKVEVPILMDIEGCLVWIALLASIGGLIISWFVGIKLPGLEYNNQKVEAAFRKELVLAEDNKRDYAKPETVLGLFTGIRYNYHRLYLHNSYFNLWIYIYDQFMTILPYLIMAPSLFTGTILMGTLIQVSNAFGKVHGSFSIFIHNWTTITELRSIYKRLTEFESNLDRYSKEM